MTPGAVSPNTVPPGPGLVRLALVGPWEVLYRPGEGDCLVLSCASIGHDPSRMPSPEWVGTTRPHPALFLQDRSRSWATSPGLAEALTQALATLPRRRILGIGTSMGAFVALHLSHLVPMEALIAIAPQHRPAGDPRWLPWTARLPEGLTASPPATRAYILHAADDAVLPPAPTTDRLTFPQGHSALALHLKPAMPGLIAAALAQDRRRFLRLATSAGGQRQKETP